VAPAKHRRAGAARGGTAGVRRRSGLQRPGRTATRAELGTQRGEAPRPARARGVEGRARVTMAVAAALEGGREVKEEDKVCYC
jgi:hypothetical protein